jgi:hypothetical protein
MGPTEYGTYRSVNDGQSPEAKRAGRTKVPATFFAETTSQRQ